MTIAFISDIHLDFWIPIKLNGTKEDLRLDNFISNTLKPIKADVLIIGGDNSHYNQQFKKLLIKLAELKLFKKIIITYGNHDMYLVSNKQIHDYKISINKITEMKKICTDIDTVEFLDGNIIEVDGIKIGGCAMWYDYSYAKKFFNMNDFHMLQKWKQVMNDANYIYGTDHLGLNEVRSMYSYGKTKIYTFDPLLFFESEKDKLLKIIDKVDIFVSHFGPAIPPNLESKYMNIDTGFYYFDGEHYLWGEKAPKLWIFGHTHTKYEWKVNNTWMVSNPLGYKSENTGTSIDIIELDDLY